MTDAAIKVENISKMYHLGEFFRSTSSIRERLMQSIRHLMRLPQSNPDPNGRHDCRRLRSKTNETMWALKEISFEVKPGEIVGIVGSNGAGKSTLLKILSRITKPTAGRAVINGRVGSLLEVGTGFHPELTGRENVFLNGSILGMSYEEIKQKFNNIVAFANVGRFIDTPVKRYSSGMKVRLGFAVAAHLDPEILLIDEVLAVGDAEFRKKCLSKMGDLSSIGKTVLFVSHNLGSIRRLCDKAIRLERGRIIRIGSSKEVVEEYLSEGIRTKGKVALTPDKSKVMCLHAISVLNESGEPSANLKVSEPIRVRLEYSVNRNIDRANVVCFFSTAEGMVILSTGDADCTPDRFGVRQAGYYTTFFDIPAYLLGEGTYTITANLAIPFEKIFDRHESVISFNILDTGEDSKPWLKNPRPGILGIRIPWNYSNNS
jgi:lipopolysaccharide transport system ATP-binding protein